MKMNNSSDKLLTPEETAEFLNVSVSTLSKWRMHGRGPVYIKMSTNDRSAVRYRMIDLENFIKEQRVMPAAI